MARGSGADDTTLGRPRGCLDPPRYGNLSVAEQVLLDTLLGGGLPPDDAETARIVAALLRDNEEEQEWRHWTQHLIGLAKLAVARGDLADARALGARYWPNALAYKQLAQGHNTLERELGEQAAAGRLPATLLREKAEVLAMTLVALDKERALRRSRTPHLEALIAALDADDQAAAEAALAAINSSRSLDEDAFAWASRFYAAARCAAEPCGDAL